MMGISYQKKRQTPKRDVVRSSRARGAKFAVIRKNCGIFIA